MGIHVKINETAGMPDPLSELEKQIDILFDELKTKINKPENKKAKTSTNDDLHAWLVKYGYVDEWCSVEKYYTIQNYYKSLNEALVSEKDVYAVLDEYKEKLKELVRAFKNNSNSSPPNQSPTPPKPVPTPVPVTPPQPNSTGQIPPASTPTQTPITPPEFKETPVLPSVPTTTVVPPTVTPPAPKVEKPIAKENPTTEPVPEKQSQPTNANEPKTEDGKKRKYLAKMGMAIEHLKNEDENKTPERKEVEDYMHEEDELLDMILSIHSDVDNYINIAKEYLEKENKPKPTMTSPTRGAMTDVPPPFVQDDPTTTIDELKEMTPNQFRAWITKNAPDFIEAYPEGTKWWKGSDRKDIIRSIEISRSEIKKKQNLPKTESVQYKINKFKEMLRKDNRPEFLLHEAAKLPLSERVNFYKKKLNSRDKFSAT